MKLVLLATIAVILGVGIALGESADSSRTSPDYSLFDLYQYHQNDSLLLQQACGITAGWRLGHSRFVYEFQRPLIPFVRFRGRVNKDRVASTAIVMSLALAVSAWSMLLAGDSDEQIDAKIMKAMTPFGSHIGYQPIRELTIYAGLVPDVILFTEDNGLLLQARVGCRFDVNKGIAVNAGIAKTALCGFKHAGGVFPLGASLGISYAPPHGKWAD